MLIIVILYLIITFILGYLAKKKSKTARSFHGANLGILMCVVAGAGEWMGGTSTTGVSEYGYLYGISGAWYTIANGIGILFCSVFFAKLYRSLNQPTIPGIISHYIGQNARTVSSAILIFVMLMVGVSQMIAIGTLGHILFDLNIGVSIAVLGIVVLVYTLLGGMVAVGYTNTMHLIVMYVGVIAAVIGAFYKSGGVSEVMASLPESYTQISSIGGVKISSWVIASILGACTAQAGIQPVLMARDEKVAVKASLYISLIVAPFGILTAILGMVAKVWYPNLSSAKLALPMLMNGLPAIMSGLVIAAMLAAILSTASPIFLSCGTLFTKDIYRRICPDVNDKKELVISRISTAAAGIVCIVLAILMFNFSAVLDIVYFAYSLRGSLFIVLLFGIYSNKYKIPERQAITAMIITSMVGLGWVIYKSVCGHYPISDYISETYASVIAAFISMAIIKILSIRKSIVKRNDEI